MVAIWAFTWARDPHSYRTNALRKAWEHFRRLSVTEQVSYALAGAYACLLILVLIAFLIAPARFAAAAMEDISGGIADDHATDTPFHKVVFNTVALVGILGSTRWALSRWLSRHGQGIHAANFLGHDAVKHRLPYHTELGATDSWENKIKSQADGTLHIWLHSEGGGVGKSSLAFRLAATLKEFQPGLHAALIVDGSWDGKLEEYLARKLRVGHRRPSVKMVRRMCSAGMLLPVFDGLSEYSEDPPDTSWMRWSVVTARIAPPPNSQWLTAELKSIQSREQVMKLCRAYSPTEEHAEAALEWLNSIRGGEEEPIKPLMVRIALEVARPKEDPEAFARPTTMSYPQLVDQYVRALHKGDAISLDSFVRAAKVVAFAVVERTWTPRWEAKSVVYANLRDEAERTPFLDSDGSELSHEAVLAALGTAGLVVESQSLLRELAFVEDLVSEFLAAAWIFEGDKEHRLAGAQKVASFSEVLIAVRGGGGVYPSTSAQTPVSVTAC
jgi:hypothetical protein